MIIDDEKIVHELSKVGVRVKGIYDLVNTKNKYPEAIPVLIDLVQKDFSNINVREGIVRALTVKEAKGLANGTLLKIYTDTPKELHFFRWAIGGAFSVILMKDDVPEVLRIVKNRENGTSRQMFVMALGKIKNSEEVEKTLIELLDDEDVVIHAIDALQKIKSYKARKKIERLMDNPRSIVRRLAKKYLEKIK